MSHGENSPQPAAPTAAFAAGQLRDAKGARGPPPQSTPEATITMPQLQRPVVQTGPGGGDGEGREAGHGAQQGGAGTGAEGTGGKGGGRWQGRARTKARVREGQGRGQR